MDAVLSALDGERANLLRALVLDRVRQEGGDVSLELTREPDDALAVLAVLRGYLRGSVEEMT